MEWGGCQILVIVERTTTMLLCAFSIIVAPIPMDVLSHVFTPTGW